MVETKEDQAARDIAAWVRQASEAGRLISESDIGQRVAESFPWLLSPAAGLSEGVETILKRAFESSEDLHELAAEDGSRRYFSSRFMTPAYAKILLRREGDSLRLIAETVRENSAVYPRPVPLEIFTRPPFGLPHDEIVRDLERMAAEEEYRDIASTTTSASRVFLYSTLHLEPDHASMLAEWLDVGQLNNP